MAAGWHNLPEVIFSEIMMTVGLESFGVLQKCRGVCKTWNVMICEMTRNEKKAIIREFENLAAKIQPMIQATLATLPEISTIAYLAHQTPLNINIPYEQRLLCPDDVRLQDVDLASVPAEHLASLAPYVDHRLQIINVRTTTPILDNIKCKFLVIKKQSLSSEETQALVGAMESRVDNVELRDGVNLDFTTLAQYSGHGKCEWVGCYGDTADKYREEVKSWGERVNWTGLKRSQWTLSSQETLKQIQIDCEDRYCSLRFLDSTGPCVRYKLDRKNPPPVFKL